MQGACFDMVVEIFWRMGKNMNEQKVLIIDRDSCVISTLCEYLSDELYDVFTARDGVAGFKTLRREKIDLAVVDIDIRDLDAISLLTCLKVEEIQTNVLIIGGMGRLESIERMFKLGAVGVLDKPIRKDKFLAKVKKCMPSQDWIKRSLESFLEEHYCNPELNFDDVMNHFRFSRSHGCKLFKKHVGKTFSEKLREIRVAQAQRLIKRHSIFVYEIASECGFLSSNRLREAFKTIHGMPPTEYRTKVMRGEIQAFLEDV